jgi:hypothetical protein
MTSVASLTDIFPVRRKVRSLNGGTVFEQQEFPRRSTIDNSWVPKSPGDLISLLRPNLPARVETPRRRRKKPGVISLRHLHAIGDDVGKIKPV